MSSENVHSNENISLDDDLYDSVLDGNSVDKEDQQEDLGSQEQLDKEERTSVTSTTTSVFDHKRKSDAYLVSSSLYFDIPLYMIFTIPNV